MMAMKHCEKCIHYDKCKADMDVAPDDTFSFFPYNEDCPHFKNKADYADVKYGEWIRNKPNPEQMKVFHDMGISKGMALQSIYWTCSCCGTWGTPRYKYCQECGAKMEWRKRT